MKLNNQILRIKSNQEEVVKYPIFNFIHNKILFFLLDDKFSSDFHDHTTRNLLVQNDEGLINKVSTDSKKNENSENQNGFTPPKNDNIARKLDKSLSLINFSNDSKDFEGSPYNKIRELLN